MNDGSAPYFAFALLDQEDPFAPPPAHVVKYSAVRTPCVVQPWICTCCKDWTERGSYAARKCTRCGTARPDDS